MSKDFKYQCPACKKGFNKTARNENKDVCCPNCEVLLNYKRGYDVKEKAMVGRYFLRKDETQVDKAASTAKPKLKLVSGAGEQPEVYKVIDDGGVQVFKNVNYSVIFRNVLAEILHCPRCGKVTTRNNLMLGSFEFYCKEPLDPKRYDLDKPTKCYTRIRYSFTR